MEVCYSDIPKIFKIFQSFIRDVETNASCPCMENQAKFDLGRFMPHPRCSQTFRDITCTSMIGAKNCYMSVIFCFLIHTRAVSKQKNLQKSYPKSGDFLDLWTSLSEIKTRKSLSSV